MYMHFITFQIIPLFVSSVFVLWLYSTEIRRGFVVINCFRRLLPVHLSKMFVFLLPVCSNLDCEIRWCPVKSLWTFSCVENYVIYGNCHLGEVYVLIVLCTEKCRVVQSLCYDTYFNTMCINACWNLPFAELVNFFFKPV